MKTRRRDARPAALILAALLFAAPAAAQRRRPSPRTPAPPPAPAAAASPQQEIERPFDASVSADSYAIYVEVRKLGQLVWTSEVRTALDAFRLTGELPGELIGVIDFVTANEEALSPVRVVSTAMPTRPDIPQGLLALHFPTPEAARAFEPKLRAFLSAQGLAEPSTPPKARGARRARHPESQTKKTAPFSLVVKRAGSWIYAADQAFTFKRLKGDGTNLVADNARLQSFRNRLASESVFVYFDVALSKRGWQLQLEEAQKKEEVSRIEATTATPDVMTTTVTADPTLTPPSNTPPPAPTPDETVTAEAPTPEVVETPAEVEVAESPVAEGEKKVVTVKPSVQSREEQAARVMMSRLMSGIFSGGLREPEAVGVGVALEGDVVAARVLVAKEAGDPINIIPFFPNVVSGPAIAPDSLSIAPADTEIFFAASLDWSRIYESLLTNMDKPPSRGDVLREGGFTAADGSDEDGGEVQLASAEKSIEAMEKLFGFRIREDLLPALGNEIAVSLPLDWLDGRRRSVDEEAAAEEKAGGEKRATAGPVAIISLNNPEVLRKVAPFLFAALGAGGPAQTERRKGFEIQSLGGMAYAFINNFLVVGESAPAVRHVVDSYSASQTLATTNRFRDSVAWQTHQRLALAYVSDELMKGWITQTKKMASGSADPVVIAALAQLDVPLNAISYAATNEGDALLHEVRVPTGLAKLFATSSLITIKEAPVLSNEAMANYSLMRIKMAQESFKTEHNKGRYGSLEELYAEKVLDKEDAARGEYEYELHASGDKFNATATPKNYGKTGRRSFYVDETGVVRAADHKGEPATAADPPADQFE